jgi:hypothetical protein
VNAVKLGCKPVRVYHSLGDEIVREDTSFLYQTKNLGKHITRCETPAVVDSLGTLPSQVSALPDHAVRISILSQGSESKGSAGQFVSRTELVAGLVSS